MATETTPSARQSLLDAARGELADRGEAAVSLRAVARRAGLSHAAPAHFFGDRSGLLTAVAVEGFDELSTRLRALAGVGPPPARVAALGRAYFGFGWEHPALMELMFRGADLHGDDPRLGDVRAQAIEPLVAAVAGTGADRPLHLTLICWAFVHGLVVLSRERVMAALIGPDADDERVAADLVDRFVLAVFPEVGREA